MDEDILLRLDEIERKLRDYPLLSSMQPMAHTIPIADANGKLNDWIDGDQLANVLVIKYIWEWNGTIHTHQNDLQGGQIDHGLALYGLEDDDHTQYAHAEGSGTRAAYQANRLNRTVTAGNGLQGGGTLTSDISLAVKLRTNPGLQVDANGIGIDYSYSHVWQALNTFNAGFKTNLIKPLADGTTAIQVQSLGSSTVISVDTTNLRVGIAKTSPQTTLHVGGSITVDNDKVIYFLTNAGANDGVGITRTSTNALKLIYGADNLHIKTTNNSYAVQLRDSSDAVKIQLHPAGTTYFNGGNVAIGKTSADHALDVKGSVNATTSVISPLLTTGAGVSMSVAPTQDLILSPGSDLVKMASGKHIQSDGYASRTTGWRVSYAGEADFRYLYTDELHTKSFITDLEQALAGGQIIAKAVAVLAQDFVLPSAGNSANFFVKDLPSAPDMAVFQANDFVGFRKFTRSGGALTVDWAWGTVTDYVDQANGTQRWTFTRHSGTPGTATGTINADALVLDFGTSGNGFYEVNAVDGLYAANSPYAQIVTWSSHPATQTIRARLGNLYGVFGIANEYGLFAGDGSATANKFIRASNNAVELHNTPLNLYDSGNATISLDPTTLSIALGSPLPTGYTTNKGFWAGKDGTTYKVRIGEPGGDQLQYDGTDLYVRADNSNYIKTSGTSIQFYSNATKMMEFSATPAVLIGQVSSGQPNVYITGGAVQIRNNTTVRVELTSAGVLKLNNSSGSTVIELDASGNNRISNKILMDGTSSAISIGATPPTSSTTGTGIWIDRTGLYSLASDVRQVWIEASSGKMYAGNGNVYFDANGITFTTSSIYTTDRTIKWGTNTKIAAYDYVNDSALFIATNSSSQTTYPTEITIATTENNYNTYRSNLTLAGMYAELRAYNQVTIENADDGLVMYMASNKIDFRVGYNSKAYIDTNGLTLNGGYVIQSTAISCRVTRSTNQSISSGAWTAISFSSATWDDRPSSLSPQWSSGTPTRLTCRADGLYLITGHLSFAGNATGRRVARIFLNGSTEIALQSHPAISTNPVHLTFSVLRKLTAGDYIELGAFQDSGGALNVLTGTYTPVLSWTRIA